MDLKKCIRGVPDYPKKGVLFYDVTTLIADPEAFKYVTDTFYERYKSKNINAVVCVESRGFIFGAALAYRLGVPIIPARKKGKLPAKTISASYQLEYGTDTLEMHSDAVKKGDNVIIVDDLLATGGTTKAVSEIVEKLGGKVVELAFVIELTFFNARKKLANYSVFSLVEYDSE